MSSESERAKLGREILRNHAIARQRIEMNRARDEWGRMERQRKIRARNPRR